jgi:general secretion pathway protein F
MPVYLCRLIDKTGGEVAIAKEAGSKEEAAALFSSGDLYMVSIKEKGDASAGPSPKPKSEDIGEFTAMLAALSDSGLALKDALAIESEIARKGSGIKALVEGILESVRKGNSFSEALEPYGDRFSRFYRGMIRIGERVGSLDRVFPRLSAYLSTRRALRERTASALAYPALVFVTAVLGVAGILAFIIPRLLGILSSLGGTAAEQARRSADAMTLASCAIASFSVVLFATALVLARLRRKDEGSAMSIDALTLRLPIVGRFLTAYETLDFAYAMEALIGGGVSVEIGLKEAAAVLGNAAFRRAVERCREDVLKGEVLSSAAGRRRELPPRVAQWIAVGERSGQVERVFEQLRRYYQGEVDRMISRFMILLEPALIIIVGVALTLFVIAFIIPLFSIYGAIL